jgi:cytochrome P450
MSEEQSGLRSYEIHQRERPGEATPLIRPGELRSPEYLNDPYRLLGILREHYPCYRDWSGNAYWITRYDDVTSVFQDDANYETRSKRWWYGIPDLGRDLSETMPVLIAQASGIDEKAPGLAEELIGRMTAVGDADLSADLARRFPNELLARILDLPADDVESFVARCVAMQRGTPADPVAEQAGRQAIAELVEYFRPLVEARRADPGADLLSAIVGIEVDGSPAGAEDVVATLLEADHDTLPGALANLWFLLLTHPDQLEAVLAERRLLKTAYLEARRHSTPVLSAPRFARHEVERFGRLLPTGALIMCSAAAANRDPRAFADPDEFLVQRKDLCQREPRGQYRADGLCSGIAIGLGKPSVHPAVPEDRPRSRYALTRDTVVLVSAMLLDAAPKIRLASGAEPVLRSLQHGDTYTCWNLPVSLR